MSASSRKVSVWLLVILLPIAGFLGWWNYRRITTGDESIVPVRSVASNWKFPHEEAWLVDETARTIAETLAFARNPKDQLDFTTEPKAGQAQTYDLRAKLDGTMVNSTFHAADFIWSPTNYTAWAQQLIQDWKLTPAPKPEETSDVFLVALADGTPKTVIRESRRISTALTKTPLDASLHEQAAFVIGAFAMHEAASDLCDSRREICRMAAHLAIARALQPQATGVVRPLAEAMLQTLVGREVPAAKMLDGIASETTGAASWVRVLRVRNACNWQLKLDENVPIEMLEGFRHRAYCVSPHFAIAWAQKLKPAPFHDLRRIILETQFGVEDGHRFAKDSLSQEAGSLAADWKAFSGRDMTQREIVELLNTPAARTVNPGLGTISANLFYLPLAIL